MARSADIVVQTLGKEILIYDLNAHKAYNLNETSSLVYQACDGKTTFDELKRKNKFTDDLIFLALDQLKSDNLIELDNSFVSPFNGISRREAIRKVGLASMVALPVIASLVAPTAAMAQSAGACVNPGGDPAGTVLFGGANCGSPDIAFCTNTCQSLGGSQCCSGTTTLTGTCPSCQCTCA